MKYKLMAVDIDGTLLNDNSELTENTKNKIKKAVERGLVLPLLQAGLFRALRA